jgi:hypothetical protein
MQFLTGCWRDIIQNTVMYERNFGIQNAGSHRNLESCNAKYGNMSEKFRNTEFSLSQEFRQL